MLGIEFSPLVLELSADAGVTTPALPVLLGRKTRTVGKFEPVIRTSYSGEGRSGSVGRVTVVGQASCSSGTSRCSP